MRLLPPAAASAAATCALALALCSSCSKRSAPSADAGAAPTDTGLTAAQAAQVLARVGDRTITLGDFAQAIDHMDQFDRMRYQAPERRKELLHEMIDVMLLADEARARGYDKDPETQEQVRQILRDALLKKDREGLPGPADIPEDKVRAYYDAHRADFHDPERRRASVIVLASRAAAERALAAARSATAAQWGELVRSRSTDPQAKANVPVEMAGDLGFVSPPGDPRGANARVPEEVRAAVFEAGAVDDVVPHLVESRGRFYVVRLTGKTEPHDRTLQDAERTIRVKLAQEGIHQKEESTLDDLRKEFPVKIDEKALEQVHVDLPAKPGVDAGSPPR